MFVDFMNFNLFDVSEAVFFWLRRNWKPITILIAAFGITTTLIAIILPLIPEFEGVPSSEVLVISAVSGLGLVAVALAMIFG